MAIYLTELDPDELWFPSPFEALNDPNGLLAFGGDLSSKRLILAYHNGIFPWYGPGEPILWWSPTPRAVFNPVKFKPAKSLKKFQKKHAYRVSINKATSSVIDHCAEVRSEEETWLNEDMRISRELPPYHSWDRSLRGHSAGLNVIALGPDKVGSGAEGGVEPRPTGVARAAVRPAGLDAGGGGAPP